MEAIRTQSQDAGQARDRNRADDAVDPAAQMVDLTIMLAHASGVGCLGVAGLSRRRNR